MSNLTLEAVEILNSLSSEGWLWEISNKIGILSTHGANQKQVHLWTYRNGLRKN